MTDSRMRNTSIVKFDDNVHSGEIKLRTPLPIMRKLQPLQISSRQVTRPL